jgi:class 3 adenylate cyclase
MMTGNPVVDTNIDPVDVARRRRRVLVRIGVPVGGLLLMIGTILLIAFYSYRANRDGALALTNDLLATLEQRIANEISGYLAPPARAVRILRDSLRDREGGDRLPLVETVGASLLRATPQITNLYAADEDGNFVLIRRGESGGTDVKIIENEPGSRRVTWIHHNAVGEEIGREDDPTDNYDPRTRSWYTGARGTDELFWTDVYIFFTQRVPGITVSARHRDARGRLYLFGVDITLDALSRFLASLKIGQSGRAVLIDGTGLLIAAPGGLAMIRQVDGQPASPRIDEAGDDVLTHAYDRFRIEGIGHRAIDVGGKIYISAVTPITGAGRDWLTLIVVPEKEFVGFIASSNRRALLMSLAIVAVAALLAWLLVRQGLRADRNARALHERQSAIGRQSNAFASLASEASLFDPARALPARTLTETLAGVADARRASIWRLADGGQTLRCEDSFDHETARHLDGLELHHGELPGLFASLLAGEEIVVADAARDRRTAELHRVLSAFGTKALISVPVRRNDQVVGAIWLEDAPATSGNQDFVRAVANMVAVRLATSSAATPVREARTAPSKTAPAPQRTPHNFAADLRPAVIDPSALHAEIYSAVAVMVLRFTDATAIPARLSGLPRCISDEIACGLQQIAADNGVPYLKLSGYEATAAAGFESPEQTAATMIADMALAVRDRCIALFDDTDRAHEFQIGVDCSVAMGGPIGREPRIFNLWGDAVRIAGTMAASALPGTVQATEAAYRRLRQDFLFRPRGSFYLPNVGSAQTFVLAGRL